VNKAALLDRDGTLIRDGGYICDFKQVEFFPFAAAAVRRLNQAGYLVIVVSNQSAVARGMCSEEQVRFLHQELQAHFAAQGAAIAAFYYCPFLADGPLAAYRRESPLRKPAPGMLLQAAADFAIDLGASYMIGDKVDDIEAGRRAGCRTVLVRTGCGNESESRFAGGGFRPDHIVDDLAAAAAVIAPGAAGRPGRE